MDSNRPRPGEGPEGGPATPLLTRGLGGVLLGLGLCAVLLVLAGAPPFDPDSDEPHPDPGPEQLLESVQASSQLHAALSQLSADERWVLGLAFFRDHSQSEIAAFTGLPLGTVKSLITRAQHKLRELLQDPGQSAPGRWH